MNEVAGVMRLPIEKHGDVSRLLRHPFGAGTGRHAGEMNAPAADVDEEEDETIDHAGLGDDLLGKEVASPEGILVPLDEVEPASLVALGSGVEAVLDQDAPDGGASDVP